MNRDELMLRAVSLAERNAASVTGGPFGAVIVKDGKVVAEASNTVTVDNDPTAHAEVNAIRKACAALGTFDLSGCELYTSCEPCPMCLAACYWAHIDRVYYAADREDAAAAGFDDSDIYREQGGRSARGRTEDTVCPHHGEGGAPSLHALGLE